MSRNSTSIKFNPGEKEIIERIREEGSFESNSEVVRFAVRKLDLDYRTDATVLEPVSFSEGTYRGIPLEDLRGEVLEIAERDPKVPPGVAGQS